jgi:hypothetical protein
MYQSKLVRQFRKDEEGAALIEYTVLIGILVVAVIATTDHGAPRGPAAFFPARRPSHRLSREVAATYNS